MEIKYVMLNDTCPVIFGEYFSHKDVAERLRRLGAVTGAGFVCGENINWVAYGRSESLNKGPGENDSKVLSRVLRGF